MEFGADRLARLRPLHDMKVLIVEDDYLQACLGAMTLEESGANILGPVPTMEDARELLNLVPPDCVVLDLKLRDDFAFLFAEELRRLEVPTVLATGYDVSVFPLQSDAKHCLLKPFSDADLVEAVRVAVRGAAVPPDGH
jgi:DNA-binding response OmpR family regulator